MCIYSKPFVGAKQGDMVSNETDPLFRDLFIAIANNEVGWDWYILDELHTAWKWFRW